MVVQSQLSPNIAEKVTIIKRPVFMAERDNNINTIPLDLLHNSTDLSYQYISYNDPEMFYSDKCILALYYSFTVMRHVLYNKQYD